MGDDLPLSVICAGRINAGWCNVYEDERFQGARRLGGLRSTRSESDNIAGRAVGLYGFGKLLYRVRVKLRSV